MPDLRLLQSPLTVSREWGDSGIAMPRSSAQGCAYHRSADFGTAPMTGRLTESQLTTMWNCGTIYHDRELNSILWDNFSPL